MKSKTFTAAFYIFILLLYYFGLFLPAKIFLANIAILPVIGGITLTVGFAILAVVLLIAEITKAKQNKKINIEKTYQQIDNIYEYAKNNLIPYKKRMRKKVVLIKLYITAMLIVLLSNSISLILLAIAEERTNVFLLTLGAVFLASFSGTIANLFKSRTISFGGFLLSEDKGGFLYSILRKHQQTLGIKTPVKIYLYLGTEICVSEANGSINLSIGIGGLSILNKEEIDSIFLHELSHVCNQDTKETIKYARLQNFLSKHSCEDWLFKNAFSIFYSWIHNCMENEYDIYSHMISLQAEIAADNEVKKKGLGHGLITACMKMDMLETFNAEPITKNIYEDEYAPNTYFYDCANAYINAVEKNKDRYLAIMEKRLSRQKPTHPSLKERMNTFSIQYPEITFIETDDFFKADKDKLFDFLNADYKRDIADSYDQGREEQYLAPLKQTQEFLAMSEEEKAKLKHFEYAQYGLAFAIIADTNSAINLYSKALEIYPNSSIAQYYKGELLLARYQDEGIELIKKAITENENYTISGSELLSDYVMRMGYSDLREELKKWSINMLQKKIDTETNRNKVVRTDKLVNTTIKESTIADLLNCCKKHSAISEMKALTKISKDGYELRIVGLAFERGFTEDAIYEAYNAVFMILDNTNDENECRYYLSVLTPPAPPFAYIFKRVKDNTIYKKEC